MKKSLTLQAKQIKINRIKNGLPVFDAGLGENPFPPPLILVKKLRDFAHLKHYTNTDGIKELQVVLGNKLVIGNGLKPLIYIAQLAFSMLYPQGTIIHLAPQWVSYKEQTNIIKCSAITINPNTETWKVDTDTLSQIISNLDGPKMLLLNNPNNPSGCIYTSDEISNIAKICKNNNVIVLADQIYDGIIHSNILTTKINCHYDRVISGFSLSKLFACGGYRFGWLKFGNNLQNMYETCKSLASSIYSCPSVALQYVALEAMKFNDPQLNFQIKFQKNVYTDVINFIKYKLSNLKLKYSNSQSAWYILIDFEYYHDILINNNINNSDQLCERLIHDIGLITISGSAFSIKKNFVLRYSAVDINVDIYLKKYSYENINKGLEQLGHWLTNLDQPSF